MQTQKQITMKLSRFLFPIFILLITINCNGQSKKTYSSQEVNQFLDVIAKNVVVCIDDFTEIKKQPTSELLIYTRHPLSQELVAEYRKNGVLKNTNDDISDLTTCEIKNYQLTNEKNKKLEFVDDVTSNDFQETSLGEFDGKLNQRLIVRKVLNHDYSILKGFITVVFKVDNDKKREVKIPVQISINDKAPD